jgi:DNA-binding response OmpR family regulator
MVAKNGKTVLIVENQPNYTQLLVKQILFAGLNPVVAITGHGGLRKAYECNPDLILLELELSDMSGLEFVSQLRQRPEADRIPIVAMSTFTNRKAECLQGGCNDFLQKPIKMIELMGRIKKFLPREFSPAIH